MWKSHNDNACTCWHSAVWLALVSGGVASRWPHAHRLFVCVFRLVFNVYLSSSSMRCDCHISSLFCGYLFACWRLHRVIVWHALTRSADRPVFILGDFNSCNLSDHLPTLQQYVDCPTRLNRILDRCYGNIPDAYKAICRPPLGKSDHNVIHLLPKYKAVVKRTKPVTKEIRVWPNKSKEQLRDCFIDTNWDIFFESCQDLDELTDTITSYIKFCEDYVLETKTMKIFPNNKSWVSKQLKTCLNERKVAFCSGNLELMQEKKETAERKYI